MLRQLHDHPRITKGVARLFLSIAISSQLNPAPYLQHKPWQQLAHVLREETMPAVLNSQFHVCTSHASRPMTMVFGLGTRLRVRMHTTFKNGVLRNGQQPSRAENSFIHQGKAPRCDGVEYLDRFRDIDVELCGLNKKTKNDTCATAHLR